MVPTWIEGAARRATVGGALVGLGLVLLTVMVAFPARLKVPAPIGYLAAGTLVMAGLLALANVFCSRRVRAWLAVALLTCMLLPAAWIAFGTGPRTCSLKVGVSSGLIGGAGCRLAFGVGTVLGLVLVFIALRSAARRGGDKG